MNFFGNKIFPLVIHSVDSVDQVDSVCTQSPSEQMSIYRRAFKHRLRVLVKSRMFLCEQENRKKNNSETNFNLSNITNIFFNKKHSYFKSNSTQELQINATIVSKDWHRKAGAKRPRPRIQS